MQKCVTSPCKHRFSLFDFVIPDEKIAIEVEGGVFTMDQHVRGSGYLKDIEKYNRAVFLDWAVFRIAGHVLYQDYTDFITTIKNYRDR